MWRPLRDFLKQLLRSDPVYGEDISADGPLHIAGSCDTRNREPYEELGSPFSPLSTEWFQTRRRGRVVKKIKPTRPGQVSVGGVIWQARSIEYLEKSIPKKQTVIVVGRQGNTLLVLPPKS